MDPRDVISNPGRQATCRMRRPKTIAQGRMMICTPGYYHKRMRYFKRKEKFWARRVASATKFTEEALAKMFRCEKRAEYYRKRVGMEPFIQHDEMFELELTEVRFRMLARDIRGLFGFDGDEQKQESLVLTAQLLNKSFRVTVPEEWLK